MGFAIKGFVLVSYIHFNLWLQWDKMWKCSRRVKGQHLPGSVYEAVLSINQSLFCSHTTARPIISWILTLGLFIGITVKQSNIVVLLCKHKQKPKQSLALRWFTYCILPVCYEISPPLLLLWFYINFYVLSILLL